VAFVGVVFSVAYVFCVCFRICAVYFSLLSPSDWSLLVHSRGSDFVCAPLAFVLDLAFYKIKVKKLGRWQDLAFYKIKVKKI
jgi:hypothetical protein